MSRYMSRCAIALVPVLALLAGCDVPNVPLAGGSTSAPAINGQVKGVAGGNVRIGLLGAKSAGQSKREIATTEVGADGSYSLQFPGSPPFDLMVNDNDSVIFTLSAYKDLNDNDRYDTSDELTEVAAQSGTFRFFVDDGPPGSYKAGWNLYQNGQYVQSFSTAFVLQ